MVKCINSNFNQTGLKAIPLVKVVFYGGESYKMKRECSTGRFNFFWPSKAVECVWLKKAV